MCSKTQGYYQPNRRIIQVGKPTHLKVAGTTGPDGNRIYWTACGLIGTPTHGAAFDPRDVDCLNCRKTRQFTYLLTGKTYGIRPNS